jgi:hypothetical protein
LALGLLQQNMQLADFSPPGFKLGLATVELGLEHGCLAGELFLESIYLGLKDVNQL